MHTLCCIIPTLRLLQLACGAVKRICLYLNFVVAAQDAAAWQTLFNNTSRALHYSTMRHKCALDWQSSAESIGCVFVSPSRASPPRPGRSDGSPCAVSSGCCRSLRHPDGKQQPRVIPSPPTETQSRQNREASAATSAHLDSYIAVSFVWGIYLTGAVSQGAVCIRKHMRNEPEVPAVLAFHLFIIFLGRGKERKRGHGLHTDYTGCLYNSRTSVIHLKITLWGNVFLTKALRLWLNKM